MIKFTGLMLFLFLSELHAQCFYSNNRVLSQSATHSSNIPKLDVLISNKLRDFEGFFGYSVDLSYANGFNAAAIPLRNGHFNGKIVLGINNEN